MAPPPSTFTPTSRVQSGTAVKGSPSEPSYFSPPRTSTIPVTPLAPEPNSGQPTPYYTPISAGPSDSSPTISQSEMFQRLAAYFPPPPTLSLTSLRHSAQQTPSPHISTCHRSENRCMDHPSPMDRSRRSPPPTHSPTMDLTSSREKHTLHVQLPLAIQPEMITVSANRGDKLKVVADAWHMENDCHYEWQISFPPRDIDMTSIHAKFEAGGHLFIDIRRVPQHS